MSLVERMPYIYWAVISAEESYFDDFLANKGAQTVNANVLLVSNLFILFCKKIKNIVNGCLKHLTGSVYYKHRSLCADWILPGWVHFNRLWLIFKNNFMWKHLSNNYLFLYLLFILVHASYCILLGWFWSLPMSHTDPRHVILHPKITGMNCFPIDLTSCLLLYEDEKKKSIYLWHMWI